MTNRQRTIALVREVPQSIADCELTHLARAPISLTRARAQHAEYVATLAELGCEVRSLPATPSLPDSVFVEDTVVALDEIAVLTRPGAESRRSELESMGEMLRPLRPLAAIREPGTLDGGDVLVLDREIVVGLSQRSNAAGASQLAAAVTPLGYTVRTVPVTGCLHLKSAVTRAGDDLLVMNTGWMDAGLFDGWRVVSCDPSEPFGANVLWTGGTVLHAAEHVRTRGRLEEAGCRVVAVPNRELAKAEGGVTCCSVLLAIAS